MKTFIAISLLVLAGMLGTTKLNSTPASHQATVAAKTCDDCGCSGPKKDGGCPDEKGKTCHCKAK